MRKLAARVVIHRLLEVTCIVPTVGTNTVPVLLLFAAPSISASNPRTKLLTCQLNPSWPPPMKTPSLFPLLKLTPKKVSVTSRLAQAPPSDWPRLPQCCRRDKIRPSERRRRIDRSRRRIRSRPRRHISGIRGYRCSYQH